MALRGATAGVTLATGNVQGAPRWCPLWVIYSLSPSAIGTRYEYILSFHRQGARDQPSMRESH
eukprot:1181609-Prorocentrum_minimum.AAC.4